MPNPLMGPVLSDVPVRTIEREELRQKLARGDRLKLVMSLNEWAFLAKHIPGAIRFNTPAELLAGLQKDEEIVVYYGALGVFDLAADARAVVVVRPANVREAQLPSGPPQEARSQSRLQLGYLPADRRLRHPEHHRCRREAAGCRRTSRTGRAAAGT